MFKVEVTSWDRHVYTAQWDTLEAAQQDAETQVQAAAGSFRNAYVRHTDGRLWWFILSCHEWRLK